VLKMLKELSRGHLGERTYRELVTAAEHTVGLPLAQGALKGEIPLLIEQNDVFARQMELVEARMEEVLRELPESARGRGRTDPEPSRALSSESYWSGPLRIPTAPMKMCSGPRGAPCPSGEHR
jgi:hypothetical protein